MKPATVSIFKRFELLTETTRKSDFVYNEKEGGGGAWSHKSNDAKGAISQSAMKIQPTGTAI